MSVERSLRMAADAARFDAMAATMQSVIDSDRMIDGEYPVYVERAKGPYIWDVDGNRYVDFLLGYGIVILGYADDRVDDAAIAEIRSGFSTGLMKPLQAELTKELVELTPGASAALLMRTGSDATGAAVRLARSLTGRDRVVRWGYNGWHDWCAEWDRGIPRATRELVDTFTYNDLDSLRAVFERHGSEIACVLMMPFKIEPPAPGFLEGVRELTAEHGALLVFDEMRSCFRMALGGAQEYFGVTADAVTYSKALGNGYAISALVGREDLLHELANVHISSSYYTNSAAMAAALATVRLIRDEPVLEHVWALGDRLQAGLRALADEFAAPLRVVGYPPMPFLEFDYATPAEVAHAKRLFYTATVRAGVFFHPNHHWYVSAAMSEEDVDLALEAGRQGFEALTEAHALHQPA